ncbi:MAG: Maf family protein [Thermodesulfobacteriota bacterium]
MNNKLILASSSPRRKMLLKNIGIEFEVVVPEYEEEKITNESPEEYVLKNSGLKALSVSDHLSDCYFALSADTVVVKNGYVLGKPVNEADAERMLKLLSGTTHKVITGFTIIDSDKQPLHTEAVTTLVDVKKLADWEIEGYIKTREPMDKAGAYGIQGIGSFMIEKIEGSYTNVVGLPVSQVVYTLNNLNIIKLF